MSFAIRRAGFPADSEQLLDMWFALFPGLESRQAEQESMRAWFARPDTATFVAHDANDPDRLIGFAEVGERSIADGCETSPVAYLEAWYVAPEWRQRGIGESLVRAAEQWSREHGYREIASDALLENTHSQRLHKKLGFAEVDRVVTFSKAL